MKVLNDKKAAFILCVNNAETAAECIYYLNRLRLPDHFETDIITIKDAASMAAGYNAGMNSSDAKYKIYMHQDVFIINPDFITDMRRVFESDPSIGILGCVGASRLGQEAIAVLSWDTGKIIHNYEPMLTEYDTAADGFKQVTALDGLLLATQYDIPWREDLMDGWDFYDISQCMEFARAGYRAAAAGQKTPWCRHDNGSSNMSKYHEYRRRFIQEYQEGSFKLSAGWEGDLEYEKVKRRLTAIIESLIRSEDRESFCAICQDPAKRKYIHVKEYKILADADFLERQYNSEKRLWAAGMDISELFHKIQSLKYLMMRIEHQAADTAQTMEQILSDYSIYAAGAVFIQNTVYKNYVYRVIRQYLEQKKYMREAAVWEALIEYGL